jgi:hypothetical protein
MTSPAVRSREQRDALKHGIRVFLVLCLVGVAFSLGLRRRLPAPGLIDGSLFADPIQSAEGVAPPFEVVRKGVLYLVTPVFVYEIRGLVVSEHDSRAFTDLSHERWKDNLNVKDVCVIWGRNVATGIYRKMTFRSRDFTCYYSYPDAATGGLFTENCLSNNHLLAGDDRMARKVRTVRRGDQIRVRGWLASYERPGTPFRRGTSTTRDDRGNGACETVYVTEFEILRPGNPGWRRLFGLSVAGAAASVLALFLL